MITNEDVAKIICENLQGICGKVCNENGDPNKLCSKCYVIANKINELFKNVSKYQVGDVVYEIYADFIPEINPDSNESRWDWKVLIRPVQIVEIRMTEYGVAYYKSEYAVGGRVVTQLTAFAPTEELAEELAKQVKKSF